uniref:Uncharacterized protein n=1 Tax=Glossina brevipalpis TaxID=37001 RepID=A0A1A9WZR4_9MUSC
MYIRAVEIVALAVLHCFLCMHIIRAPAVRMFVSLSHHHVLRFASVCSKSTPQPISNMHTKATKISCKTIVAIVLLTRPPLIKRLTKKSCIYVNWWSKSSAQVATVKDSDLF